MKYLLPILLLVLFVFAKFRKLKVYDLFCQGAKDAPPLVLSLFPYLAAIFIMTELFEKSGLSGAIIDLSADFFKIFGISKELLPLIILKPFSGSGSLAILTEIITTFGVDSYIARCAEVIYASGETIFYVAAVYYSKCTKKPPLKVFLILLVSNFISIVFAVFIVRFI